MTQQVQAEARSLSLAAILDHGYPLEEEAQESATELRRLHAQVQDLERWQEDVRSNSPLLARLEKAEAQLEAKQAVQMPEPVGEVGSGFALVWAGTGPIAPICQKWGIKVGTKLYTEQQLRAMVEESPKPLTDEQIKRIDDSTHFHESSDWELRFARAIEKAHGIGVDNAS